MKPQTPQTLLPGALGTFDLLPDIAYVDVRTVAALFGCAVPTVWRRAAAGQIPSPRRFGASARWNVGELRKALAPARGASTSRGKRK